VIIRSILIVALGCSVASAETVRVPKDHYLGISEPCSTVSDAREMAFREVAKQILRTIGGEFAIDFESRMTQDGDSLNQSADEQFRYSVSGFLSEIERNIVSASYKRTGGGVVYRMLVYVEPRQLERMRRLSMGAKVVVSNLGDGVFELHEINRVGVVLTDLEISFFEKNRHAKLLTLFVMRVSSVNSRKIKRPLREPIVLKGGGFRRVRLPIPNNSNPYSDTVLGTHRTVQIVLFGTDEVGRTVQVDVHI